MLAVLAVSAGAAALWPERSQGPTVTDPADGRSSAAVAVSGLCQAVDAARADDLPGALGIFLGRAHTPLHDLAATLDDTDRTLTARLLEAKAEVEASLPARTRTATADLELLLDLTEDAAVAIGTDIEPCQRQEPSR